MKRKPKAKPFVPEVQSDDRRTVTLAVSDDTTVTLSHHLPPDGRLDLCIRNGGTLSRYSGGYAGATLDVGMALALSDALREGVTP